MELAVALGDFLLAENHFPESKELAAKLGPRADLERVAQQEPRSRVILHVGPMSQFVDLVVGQFGPGPGQHGLLGVAQDVLAPVVVAGLVHQVVPQAGKRLGGRLGELHVVQVERLGELDRLADRLPRLPGTADEEESQGANAVLPRQLDRLADLFQGDSLVHAVEHLLVARLDAVVDPAAARGGHLLEQLVVDRVDPRPAGPEDVQLASLHLLAECPSRACG